MEDIRKLFDAFPSLRAGVIGDLMLDTYMWGKVERISPEAPVPVVSLHHKDHRIGGAANVALNISSLGASVSVLSVTGNDEEATLLEKLMKQEDIDTKYLLKNKQRVTTNKTRIISRNQQMMRLDAEVTDDLEPADEDALIGQVTRFITEQDPHVIIFEDYNKGVLTEKVITEVIGLCKKKKIITAADPKRKNFFTYRGVDIFKPNLKEVKEGLNMLFDEPHADLMKDIHRELQALLDHNASLITLSDKGIFYEDGHGSAIIPSHLRNVADVSGAGDTVIAVASLVFAATRNLHLVAEVSNIAGGLVCEEVGTVAIDKNKLLHECELLLS